MLSFIGSFPFTPSLSGLSFLRFISEGILSVPFTLISSFRIYSLIRRFRIISFLLFISLMSRMAFVKKAQLVIFLFNLWFSVFIHFGETFLIELDIFKHFNKVCYNFWFHISLFRYLPIFLWSPLLVPFSSFKNCCYPPQLIF